MSNRTKHVLFGIAVLVALTLACGGSSNTGTKVDEVDIETPAPVKLVTYGIGDVIEVSGHTIVLNSAEITAGRLVANFLIENKGSEEMAVSSLMSFEAKDDEGTKLTEDWSCSPSLGGTVLGGDKMKGNICWENASLPLKIYYEADLFGSGAVVWRIE